MRRVLTALSLAALAGCLDVGAVPTERPCQPSPDYFVSDVWPDYIRLNLCAASNCHNAEQGHGYTRFRSVPDAPPTGPLATWPEAWRANYLAATQLVRCDQPLQSRLLTVPAGLADPHKPGIEVQNLAAAEAIFQTWVTRP